MTDSIIIIGFSFITHAMLSSCLSVIEHNCVCMWWIKMNHVAVLLMYRNSVRAAYSWLQLAYSWLTAGYSWLTAGLQLTIAGL